uniref:Interleukin-12 subunit beta n=1 Tax=Apteryx owenii TaxID=8824 RepID=A0A8B9PM42_APTOW
MLCGFGFNSGQPHGVPARYIVGQLSTPRPCRASWSSAHHRHSKMLPLVGLVLCLTSAHALTAFPQKFLVGNLDEDMVVKCNTSEQQVTWTLNGEPEPMAELVAEGRTLTILGLDLPATGNYSCWAGSVLLDATYVVVRSTSPPGQEEGMNVSCQAESYRGSFRCSWRAPSFAVFRARLTRSNGSFGDWVHVAGHRGRFNANFTDPSFCPFAEELHPLQLHLEGLSDTSFLSFTVHFFIRDIVQPDPPQELTVRRRGDRLYLSWAPPASWPLPKSYFALFYRLQYELLNGTQVTLRVAPCPRHPVPSLPRALAAPCLHGPVPVLPCACVALCPHSPVPLLPLPCPLHALCPCCPVLSLPHARTAPCLCCSVPTLHCLHSYLGLFFLLS